MAKKYQNLSIIFYEYEKQISHRACEEIIEMLQSMGIPQGECYDLKIQGTSIVGISFSHKTITVYFTDYFNGECLINCSEVANSDAHTLTSIHSALRTKYNKFVKEQKCS